MARAGGKKGMPHLFSGLVASSLATAVLFAGRMVAIHLEHTTLPSTAPELFPLKNQGLAFQRAAVHTPNVLPLYGTSELITPSVPERASLFFRSAPTGFQVSPIGGGGANLLVMLQKVGALGSDLRGKKLVISLSPGWFLKVKSGRKGYEANFSPMAASKMIFGTGLDFELKRDLASRMLECPSTLEGRPVLKFALRRLASGRWLDRIVFCALWPAGKLQTVLMALQDHFAALNYIRDQIKPAPRPHPQVLDWSKLIAKASETKSPDAGNVKKALTFDAPVVWGSRDTAFRSNMNASSGWKDLELLLRTLARVHARALILSMPISGNFYDHAGISRSAREDYYTKLRALVQRYHFPLVEFKGHDEDPAFLIRHESHLTAKGWMYYNRVLDDFFHGRMPRS
ncbi:MAG TPA: D-alanyl-lipoteichoic acid biosynthesis protein DltD [Candidatus Dormibacteraeota bacterium]|nr:D-alanyl-lipoteichoic acid biosynthesis protein DltD [Candidatus Dormibacteraeota bacterium]